MKKILILCILYAINTSIYGAAVPSQQNRPELEEANSDVSAPGTSGVVPAHTQEQQSIPFKTLKSKQLTAINLSLALAPEEKELFKQMTRDAETRGSLNRARDLINAIEYANKFMGGDPDLKQRLLQTSKKEDFLTLTTHMVASDMDMKVAHFKDYIIRQIWSLSAMNPEQHRDKLLKIEETIEQVYRR